MPRFYIVSLADGAVTKTDSQEVADDYRSSDEDWVIDTLKDKWLARNPDTGAFEDWDIEEKKLYLGPSSAGER